jgi:hypothetical protein
MRDLVEWVVACLGDSGTIVKPIKAIIDVGLRHKARRSPTLPQTLDALLGETPRPH